MTRTDESGPAADRTASKNSTDTKRVTRRADIATAARHAWALEWRVSVGLPVLLAILLVFAGWFG